MRLSNANFIMESINKFHEALDYALDKLEKEDITLKEQQYNALKAAVIHRKDILAVLPTGFGKSLIYQCLPLLFLTILTPIHLLWLLLSLL